MCNENNCNCFDDILKTMYLTGKDIKKEYKETSISGLAKIIKE